MAPKNTNNKTNKWATKESGKSDDQVLDDCVKFALGKCQSTAELEADLENVTSTLGELIGKKSAYDTAKMMMPGISEKELKAMIGDNMEGLDQKIDDATKKLAELTASLAILAQLEEAKKSFKDDKDGSGEGGSNNGGRFGGGLAV